jgi:predicted FMN-binding regulatory protein PaiB
VFIPSHYRNDKIAELVSFMKAHPFAIVSCNGKQIPLVTHLPFVIAEREKIAHSFSGSELAEWMSKQKTK